MFSRKGIILLALISAFSLIGCAGAKQLQKMTDKYEVENRVTSSTMSKKLNSLINEQISIWLGNSNIVNAILEANRSNASRSEEKIKETDSTWRTAAADSQLIRSYMDNRASAFLKEIQEKSGGLFSEIFIMDYQGCNVGLSEKTSDFWQGDEDKFIISYNSGMGKVFIDSIEFDESTQKSLVQISLPIEDPAQKKVIGAVTIGVDISKL